MQYRTIVVGRVPRVKCEEHGVVQVAVSWAEESSRFTAMFEALVIDWLLEASFAAVARQLRLSWDQVAAIQDRAVQRGLARRDREPPNRGGRDVVPEAPRVRGRYQIKPELPFTPGLEVAGRISATGPGVSLAVGQRVMASTALPRGGLAAEAIAEEAGTWPIPDTLDDVRAAAMLIGYQTSHIALHRRGGLRAGETLLVHAGAGGVGSAAIQLGVAAGARVFATAGGADKTRLCRELGAELAIDYRTQDFVSIVNDATDGSGAGVIYDPVGGDTFDRSCKCIAWEGRILVIGFASGRIADLPTNHAFIKNYSVVGVYIGEYASRDHAFLERTHADLMQLHAQGRIDPLIGGDVPFDRVPQAIADLSSRKTVGKLVVRVG